MPIPTDTFWNIKKLNWIFAISAIILMATIGLAVLQDYDKEWRKPQREGRVWEAALLDEKIAGALSPAQQQHVQHLKKLTSHLDEQLKSREFDQKQIQADVSTLNEKDALQFKGDEKAHLDKLVAWTGHKEYRELTEEIAKKTSDLAPLTFDKNDLAANVTVMEAHLQDAKTAQNKDEVKKLTDELVTEEKRLKDMTEKMAAMNTDIANLRDKKEKLIADLTALNKLLKAITDDVEAMGKKQLSLQPKSITAKLSDKIRAAPLMQFANPTESVKEVVLTDVQLDMSFGMHISNIDRCMTCHVHIDRKDFTEEKVLAFLERSLAESRGLRSALAPAKPQEPDVASFEKPGAVAMSDFWVSWGRKLLPPATFITPRKNQPEMGIKALSLNPILTAIGKTLKISVDGKEVIGNVMDRAKPASTQPFAEGELEKIVVAAIQQLISDKDAPANLRNIALQYPEAVRTALATSLNKNDSKILRERYRYALCEQVNSARAKKGLPELDPSSTQLAHPRLDLYAEMDSPHKIEAVGCTSCHDGSGQETDFVLAAHRARQIWVDTKSGEPVLAQQVKPKEQSHEAHGPDLSSMLEAAIESGPNSMYLYPSSHGGAHGATTQPAHGEAAHGDAPKAANHNGASAAPKPTEDAGVLEYIDPVSGKKSRAVAQSKFWADKYEFASGTNFTTVYELWDWPMRSTEYLQANCARCHTNIHDVKEEAPILYQGRALFAKYGCVNCHQMDSIPRDDGTSGAVVEQAPGVPARKVGPDLRHIQEKLSKEFTSSWVWAPKTFRPSTNMPHFFMLENSSSDEELRRTQQEVRSITEYLYQVSTPTEPLKDIPGGRYTPPKVSDEPKDVDERIKKGRELFYGDETKPVGLGCLACHANLNDSPGGGSETIGEKWIMAELVHGGHFAKELTAKNNGKAPSESELTEAAKKKYDEMSYNDRQLFASEHFGTVVTPLATPRYADGTEKPVFMHHGPELSGVGTKLTTGRGKEEARGWLYDWLKNPRHYSAYTIMPSLRLSDEEALNLAEYLISQKRPTMTDEDRAKLASAHGEEATKIKEDKWEAKIFPRDSAKAKELLAFFLRSRFSEDVADEKADDLKKDGQYQLAEAGPRKGKHLATPEVEDGAAEALVTKDVTKEQAKKRVENWDPDTMREVMLGKKLVAHYGCMNCHAINGAETLASPCANLSDWGQKAIDKLDFGYLNPHTVHDLEPLKVPLVNGLSTATTHIVDDLQKKNWDDRISKSVELSWPHLQHSRESWIEQKISNSRVYDRGKNLLEPIRKFVDGKVERDKDGNPVLEARGKPYDKTKMPTFYMRDEEIKAITTFVVSNRDRLIGSRLLGKVNNDQAQRIAHGRQIAERFNCVSCHKIEQNQPQIQQYWSMLGKTDDLPKNSPPSLRGEGNKIQHQWLFGFLKNVEKIRPLPYVRMPSFPITDDESAEIAAYFNAASNRESNHLRDKIDLILKDAPRVKTVVSYQPHGLPKVAHMSSDDAATKPTAVAASAPSEPTTQPFVRQEGIERPATPADIWPKDDWYRQDKNSYIVEYLRNWALMNGLAKPAAFSERTNKPEELAATYMSILYRARFVMTLFEAPYPFTSAPQPLTTEEDARFKKGEQFFYELNCLQCHAMGDPNKRGVGVSDWSAPNMNSVARRLQRRWVNSWVQEPPIIQANTPMPAFFSGETPNPLTPPDMQKTPTYKLDGQDWATAIGMSVAPGPDGSNTITNAKPAFIREHYGITSQEQKDLLLDFVFTASARGYTATEPAPEQLASFASNAKGSPIQPATQPVRKVVSGGDDGPPPPPKTVMIENPGTIKGVVKLNGKPPEPKEIAMAGVEACAKQHAVPPVDDSVVVDDNGNLRYAVISISSGLNVSGTFPVPPPAVVDQKGCMYEPHVIAVMTGQDIRFKSTDPFAHNVHTDDKNIQTVGPDPVGKSIGAQKTPTKMRVKCDVHTWMSMHIASFEHPYFAVSATDGTFTITNVPAGTYTLTLWHEKYGEMSQQVTVEGNKEAKANFEVKAK